MPAQVKWLLETDICLNLKRTLKLRCRGRFHPSCQITFDRFLEREWFGPADVEQKIKHLRFTARYRKADLVPEKKSRPAAGTLDFKPQEVILL
jgi:hypothetical protein